MRSRGPEPPDGMPHVVARCQLCWGQWWLDRSVRTKGLIVVTAPLVALLVTTIASVALQYQERQDRAIATAGLNVTNAAQRVLSDAVNGESGIRGYAATGAPLFLQPYRTMLARMPAARRAFHTAAVADHDVPAQRAADRTVGQVLGALAQMRLAIVHRVPRPELGRQLAHGKAIMDRLRGQIAGIINVPQAELAVRRADVGGLETSIDVLSLTGLALGLLAGLGGIALFTTGVARRVVATAGNATRLGEGRPLEPFRPAGDEIGQVALAHAQAQKLLASRSAQLTAARDEALTASQAKNAFLSSTSHELRTPLNSILGFTQLLEMSDLSTEDQDSVQRILKAGRHLLALINEIIDIARIESGELSVSMEPVAVLPVIEEASQLMAPLAAERALGIQYRCAEPYLAVYADRQRLSQILVNLISNAVKYNRPDGSITVSCQAGDGGQVGLTVTDTGPGLSAGDLSRIFIPFERLSAAQTTIEGTDIAPAATAGAGPGLRPASAGGRLRVLYIEDNPANVEVVSRFLKSRPGTQLSCESSGQAGLQAARRDRPDLILLDLHLEDLQGEQVLNALRASRATAGIPVVVLSAEAERGVIRRLLANGATAYLTKPLDLSELGDLVDSLAAATAGRRACAASRPPIRRKDEPSCRPRCCTSMTARTTCGWWPGSWAGTARAPSCWSRGPGRMACGPRSSRGPG
jgi:signal transduction histidine kinase/CheY-like chemotaxis protein